MGGLLGGGGGGGGGGAKGYVGPPLKLLGGLPPPPPPVPMPMWYEKALCSGLWFSGAASLKRLLLPGIA